MSDPERKDVLRANTAAGGHGDPAGGRRPDDGRRHLPWRRVALGIVAAAVISFCAWSMSEYVNGRDPLAFLTSPDATSATDDSSSSSSEEAGGDISLSSNAIGREDVISAIGELEFAGEDVAVRSDDVSVAISGDGIWVEQSDLEDAATMVERTSQRASALAQWAKGTGVEVSSVTWISEDASGAVRMALTMSADSAPGKGGTADLLGHALGYRICGDAYSSLDSPDFAQGAGESPTLPDGTEIAVDEGTTDGGESLDASSATSTSRTLVSSTSGEGSGGTSGGTEDDAIVVHVTVDGSLGDAGTSSATVSLGTGSTAYDALVATGVDVSAKGTAYGIYVSGIGGLSAGSDTGWVYAVNGSEPNVSADSYELSDGDSVTWTFVSVQ